ncbi:uncharacterized protein LOC135820768 [Sycon ciliatum]|uniref:uncharacterized protein LOC135820768 n=1 Tax=Sycon ciliatum TaxID=27933 RepID=UPI0031F63FCA
MLRVDADAVRGLSPAGSTPPSSASYMNPGPVVSAGGKVKSTGRKTDQTMPSSPPRPLMPPVPIQGRLPPGPLPPGHPPPGHMVPPHYPAGPPGHYPPPGAPGPGPPHLLPSPPVHQPPVQLPPAPQVVAVSSNVHRAVIPLPESYSRLVQDRVKVHTDFHETRGTFVSYIDGQISVQGTDANSVKKISLETYKVVCEVLASQAPQPMSMPMAYGQPLPQQQQQPLPPHMQHPQQQHPQQQQQQQEQQQKQKQKGAPMPSPTTAASYPQSLATEILTVESHLMHFLVHRRGNLIDKLQEKHPDVEVRGFKTGSTTLEFVGEDCRQALEFVKARYNGYQSEEVSCKTELVEPACHAIRNNNSAIVYVPPPAPTSAKGGGGGGGGKKATPEITTLTIGALGRKPIDEVKQVLSSPDVANVNVPGDFLRTLRVHPTCSLTILREDFHVAYTVRRDQDAVILQGFAAEDLQAAADRLKEFVASQLALQEAKTEMLRCSSGVAMRFLKHALYTLQDENAQTAIEDIENRHSVSIGRNEDGQITIRGLSSCIASAQSDINSGVLLGNFKYKRHELPGKREAFMRLIKRTALKRIEDEHRVVCFMHYEQGKGGPVPRGNRRDSSSSETGRASGGAFRDKSAGHKAPSAATLGNIIIELCGIIQDELDVAFKQLQKIDVFSELWRLPSEEEFWMVDAWRKSGVLAKLDDQLEFFPDPKAKILFCNALTKAGAKGGIELVRQRIAKHRKEEVALPLTPALQQFIRVKRQDWLTDLEQIHGVKVNADSDEWTVVGSHEDVEQVCLKFQDLRDMCPTRRISFNPKNKRLFRHMSNRCKELRADLEDSHEATLAVSDVSRSNRGNDGHRGRGRGGSRGHGGRGRGGRGGRGGGAAAAVVDGDSADAVAGDDECVVTCVAGSQGDLDTVAEQVLEIEQLLCHIPLRLSEAHATLLREGLKARTVQTYQHRSNVFVDKTLAHINAMTREEAESMRDTIQAFIGGHETQHEEFAFPSDVVAQIVTSSEMRRVIDIASKRGVRVQKVYGTAGYSDSNDDGEGTPRSRRMHLSLSGLQDAVLDVRQELQQFVDQVAQSVETLQVCAQGLQVTALLDHVGDIRAVERQFKVSCTWTSLSRLARSAASHVNDDSDADDDADDDAYDGGHTATDQSSGAAQSASVSIGSFPAGIPVGDIAAKATAALARSQSIPLDATTVTGAINTMTSVRSRGLFSTLGSLFTRQSSTSSNDGASFTPAAAATATPTSTTPSSSLSSWQWQDNDGWKAYPADQCKSIDLASARGTKCDICIGTTRYRIDPVNMIQTNLETGFARRIRRTTSATASPATTGVSAFTAGGIAAADAGARASPATVTGGSAVWQYQDDTGAFSNYSSKHNAELEQQYLATPSGNAILSRGQYTYAVDFVKMQQTNLVTEKSRPVRRIHGSKTSSSAASSTSSSATTPLTTSFDPVKTGVVPREVQISIEGKSPSVQLAAAKIQQLLNDSIVEQKVSMTTGYTHWLSRRFKSVSASHLVSMEVTGVRSATSSVSSSSSSAAASSGKGQCVVLRGTKKRVERAETQVYKASAQAASRKQATSASAAAIAAASAAAVECPLPKEWEPMSGELELKQVALGSPEFNQVQKLVHFSLPNAKIQRIDRIQNKFLWKKYNQMKDSISEKIKTNAAEKLLFHGTRGNSPDKIYRSEVGFDMRYSSSGMWGQANYFASEAKYSDGYSHTAPHLNGERQIFLAKVIVGDSIEMTSTSGLRMPPVKAGVSSSAIGDIRYDTVNGVTNSTRVYMVYHNCQAYPFYLLTYRQS